jgi:hypothetical protein
MPNKFHAVAGTKHWKWTLVEEVPTDGYATKWRVKCDCGTTTVKILSKVVTGQSQSCGCTRGKAHQRVMASLSGGA